LQLTWKISARLFISSSLAQADDELGTDISTKKAEQSAVSNI
jgi:hypothetical protein